MTIFGTTNWWLPGWLSRLLPHISVESKEDIEAGAEKIVDITLVWSDRRGLGSFTRLVDAAVPLIPAGRFTAFMYIIAVSVLLGRGRLGRAGRPARPAVAA
jgi:uncharacterized membrane protein YdfJ with MMPL/SSD domain